MTPSPPIPDDAPAAHRALNWIEQEPGAQRTSLEIVSAPTWSVARWWSTAGTFDAGSLGPGATRMILGVRGTATASIDHDPVEFPPDQLLLVPGDRPLRTTNDTLWARVEWHLRSPALTQRSIQSQVSKPLQISPEHRTLITSITNAISTNARLSDPVSASPLLDTLTGVILSTVSDARRIHRALTPNQNELLRSAATIIDLHYLDPRFGVAELAAAANVSPRYLRRLFSSIETTPRSEIERRRVAAAEAIIALAPPHHGQRLNDIAVRTGFTSAKQLRRALDRQQAARTPHAHPNGG